MLGLSAFLFAACALVESPAERANSLASEAGFDRFEVPGTNLRAYSRGGSARRLVIYIEGDGAPWRTPDDPPADPTPLKHLVLGMAVSDPSVGVAYLARQCQYLTVAELAHCDPDLWMQGRFREDAVVASNQAIDALKRRHSAEEIALVGYSGGGAMAALLAARRRDVRCLVTIAAPLDTRTWTATIGVSPLVNSLNPLDFAGRLRNVRQTHIRGLDDTLVPPVTSQRFVDSIQGANVVDLKAFDHDCCWAKGWVMLRKRTCLES